MKNRKEFLLKMQVLSYSFEFSEIMNTIHLFHRRRLSGIYVKRIGINIGSNSSNSSNLESIIAEVALGV